jgi:hypothetical protein
MNTKNVPKSFTKGLFTNILPTRYCGYALRVVA